MTSLFSQIARANEAMVLAFAGITVSFWEHTNLVLSTIAAVVAIVSGTYSIGAHRAAIKHANVAAELDKELIARTVAQNVREAEMNARAAEQNARAAQQTVREVLSKTQMISLNEIKNTGS